MNEHFIAPECGGWLAIVKHIDQTEATLLAFETMANCKCDLRTVVYSSHSLFKNQTLLGWTFTHRGCNHIKNAGID